MDTGGQKNHASVPSTWYRPALIIQPLPFLVDTESQNEMEGLAPCGAGMQSYSLISKLVDSRETTCCVFGSFYVSGECT